MQDSACAASVASVATAWDLVGSKVFVVAAQGASYFVGEYAVCIEDSFAFVELVALAFAVVVVAG